MIDLLYRDEDKNHFYLGMISQVYTNTSVVQVENLSWLNFRKMKNELLIPNTINFFVIIDSTIGIFLGEVYQSKIPSSNSVHDALINQNSESIYPEISIKIIGILDRKNHKLKLSGFQTVGLTDKVYIANREILNIFLKSIEVKKNNDDESNLSSFAKISNMFFTEVLIRPSTLFDRHLMTVGTTNSGKSTTSLSILDKLIKKIRKYL